MGTIQIDGSTPKLTIGNATAEDALILFDGNAQDFHIGLDDTADDLVIGVGSALGTTTALAIDENAGSTFSGTVTVGVDDTGKDVKFFGASAGSYALWDESANLLDLRGATAAGPGHLKLTTGELTVVDADVLGKIEFQAPLESSGTDAILVGASIYAEADDTFAAGVNNTDLVFALGKSEAAAEKFRFTADNEIGIAGANYGSDGQVLTSGGAGAAVAWEDAAGFDVTSITGATALGATPADTDEFVLSDAGTLKRVDFSHLRENNQPYFAAFASSSQSISNNTTTKLTNLDTEIVDSGGTYNTSTCEWSPGSAGTYLVGAKIMLAHGGTSTTQASVRINLSSSVAIMKDTVNMGTTEGHLHVLGLYYSASSPTFSIYVRHNAGGSENVYGAATSGTIATDGWHESPANFWGFKVS